MKARSLSLAFLLSLTPSWSAAETELPATNPASLHLFLLAGQSNMSGRGGIDKNNNVAHPRVFTLTKENTWAPATDPLHWDSRHAGVGIGKRFGEIIADHDPKLIIGLIPTASSGTSVRQWMPGARFYNNAVEQAKKAMEKGTLKAILWHQGERDRHEKDAPLYEERLRAVIAGFRKDLGDPNLPFFIGQMGQFPQDTWEEPQKTVDAAQRRIAESTPNVFFISSDQLTGNSLHFNTPSLLRFAERYAEAYLALSSHQPLHSPATRPGSFR